MLATVAGDHLTLDDLDVELFLMKSQQGGDHVTLPASDAVLKRLIQNTLIFQEGKRLGLDQDGKVLNQVTENVRHRSVLALVDSVAFTVPEDVEDRKSAQFEAIDEFVKSLMVKYNAVVDSLLLKSLDYASADEATQTYLRNSDDVLCTTSFNFMRVRSLTSRLMFQEFHGMIGKSNAADIRDRNFSEWVTEALLTHESRVQGIPDNPKMRMLARYHTRDLVLEETIGLLSKININPTDQDLRDFYEANIEHLTPPARIKVESVMLGDEDAARLFKSRLDQGAEMKWLSGRTAEIVKEVAAIPTSWLNPAMIGLQPGEERVGLIMEPMGVPGGWVVARISEIEQPLPVPLEECRDEVMQRLKTERTRTAVSDAVKLLEKEAEIEIAPNAMEIITEHLVEWKGKNDD